MTTTTLSNDTDYEDRMTSATVNSVTTTFAYRGDGLRNSRTTGGNTTTFTWDIAGGLQVVLDDGAKYVYGAGLVSQVSGANTYYYLADGLGSTMKTVDATGAVVNGYTYDVYGKKTSSTGSQVNEFDFAGQQTDATGFQYLRARYMDPETGMFLSRDPLAVLPGWGGNPVAYGAGNPMRWVDPTGFVPTDGDGEASAWHLFVDLWSEIPNTSSWVEYHAISREGKGVADGFRFCSLVNEKGSPTYGCGDTISVVDFQNRYITPGLLDDAAKHVLNTVTSVLLGIKGITNQRAKCIAKKAGYDSVEDLKADFVGRKGVSRFDLFKDEATGEILIGRKGGGGEHINTGFSADGC